jgi:hypothetical protein
VRPVIARGGGVTGLPNGETFTCLTPIRRSGPRSGGPRLPGYVPGSANCPSLLQGGGQGFPAS